MIPSPDKPRKRRGAALLLEPLDTRQLLSAGMGSTFAIMPGSVDKAGQASSVQFKIDPSQFTAGRRGKMVLGIDVAADPSGAVKPQIVSIKTDSGRIAASLRHTRYTAAVIKSNKVASPISTAVLATIPIPKAGQKPVTYTVQVKGQNGTTGKYLVGFFLPGDADGNGMVNATDVQTIASKFASVPTSSNYSFDADVNRDGKISVSDLRYASENIGTKTTISPVIDVNLDPATDGPLRSRITNFRTVRFTGTVTPGAAVAFSEINNKSAGAATTADATGNYSIMVPLGDGSNTFKVATSDAFGQSISGQIAPVTYTLNPPQVVNTVPKTT